MRNLIAVLTILLLAFASAEGMVIRTAFACFQAVTIHFHNGGKSGCFARLEAFSIENAGDAKLRVLNQAVVEHDLQHLRSLLSVSRSQEELDNALIAAAGVGNEEAAGELLKRGANPNATISVLGFTTTPLIVAVRENQTSVLQILLEQGGDPNFGDSLGWRPLHHALIANSEGLDVIRVLLQHGADANAVDSLQRTPLHRAAMFGHTEAARLLLAAGANPTLREKYGNTAADRAAKAGYDELASMLR